MLLENKFFRLKFGADGSLVSLFLKQQETELVAEPRLSGLFRLLAPQEGYIANYANQQGSEPNFNKEDNLLTISFPNVLCHEGREEIAVAIKIALLENTVRFSARVQNDSNLHVDEVWFPQIGGMRNLCGRRDSVFTLPQKAGGAQKLSLFQNFPAGIPLGGEAAELARAYPTELSMAWWSMENQNGAGLYFGAHEARFRFSSFLWNLYPTNSGAPDSYLTPEEAGSQPVGLVFSHVHYPHLAPHESCEIGPFDITLYQSNETSGLALYQKHLHKVTPPAAPGFLSGGQTVLGGIGYEEGKSLCDYGFYNDFPGASCFEFVRFPSGSPDADGLDYDTKAYAKKREAFSGLCRQVHESGKKILVAMTFNLADCNAPFYRKNLHGERRMDGFSDGPNFLGTGSGRILSMTKTVKALLLRQMTEAAACGADGVTLLDLEHTICQNPKTPYAADEALCQGVLDALSEGLAACREINPDFCLGIKTNADRILPLASVILGLPESPALPVRAASVVSGYQDFDAINAALLENKTMFLSQGIYQSAYRGPLWQRMADYINAACKVQAHLAGAMETECTGPHL